MHCLPNGVVDVCLLCGVILGSQARQSGAALLAPVTPPSLFFLQPQSHCVCVCAHIFNHNFISFSFFRICQFDLCDVGVTHILMSSYLSQFSYFVVGKCSKIAIY